MKQIPTTLIMRLFLFQKKNTKINKKIIKLKLSVLRYHSLNLNSVVVENVDFFALYRMSPILDETDSYNSHYEGICIPKKNTKKNKKIIKLKLSVLRYHSLNLNSVWLKM